MFTPFSPQSSTLIFSPHGIAMPKGLYFTAVVSFFVFSTPLLDHWTDLNQTWTHIHPWLLFENCRLNFPGIYPYGLGAKNVFGTDFELWPNISLQWNKISTIGTKLVNVKGLPYMPTNLEDFGPEMAVGEFLPTPYIFASGDTASLTAWTFNIYQTEAKHWNLLFSGTSLQSRTTECQAGSRWALPCF